MSEINKLVSKNLNIFLAEFIGSQSFILTMCRYIVVKRSFIYSKWHTQVNQKLNLECMCDCVSFVCVLCACKCGLQSFPSMRKLMAPHTVFGVGVCVLLTSGKIYFHVFYSFFFLFSLWLFIPLH